MSVYLSKDSCVYKNGSVSRKIRSILFLGVFGSSMSALAEYFLSLGYTVYGFDDAWGVAESHLLSEGVRMTREIPYGIDLAVRTLAIGEDREECLEIYRRGIPLITRAELLGVVMRGYRHRIGISGTHGKSTVTALTDRIFSDRGLSPTTFSGAPLDGSSSYRKGGENYFIYEACEYRDAFLSFSPTTAVITSLEIDHTDYFSGEDMLLDSFQRSIISAHRVVINADYPLLQRLSTKGKGVYTYGWSADLDYVISEENGALKITHGKKVYTLWPKIFGRHNYENITAALILGELYGIDEGSIQRSLSEFGGVGRRLERLGELDGRIIYYDYAHHPREISASIRALKEKHGRITVIFRPHTYTRTRDLWAGFVESLGSADEVVVTDVFPAREERIEGIDGSSLAGSIGSARYIPLSELYDFINENDEKTPLVLMGAGDFSEIIKLIKKRLK